MWKGNFLRADKEKMIRNQPVGHYLMQTRIKLFKGKQNIYKVNQFDQD